MSVTAFSGPSCVAEAPFLDTADGREHDECPDPTAAVERLIEIEDERRVVKAWLLRYMILHDLKAIEFGDRVARLKKMPTLCLACEQKKRESTQFWHEGADSEFPYVTIEKKKRGAA